MRLSKRSLGRLAAAMLAPMLFGGASASAFEAHNFIEPPFGSFKHVFGLAVDQSTGNVFVLDDGILGKPGNREVLVFGAAGGAPAGGGPSSFTGAGSTQGNWSESEGYVTGVAVDNACTQRGLSASQCEAFDPSDGDVYVYDARHGAVDKYRLNGANGYEYVSQSCGGKTQSSGIAVDSAGDVYAFNGRAPISECNAAGELIQEISIGPFGPKEFELFNSLAVSPNGTIYALAYSEALGRSVVLEMKRSSPAGAVEGEPVEIPGTDGSKTVAFDDANGQLFVDLGSYVEAFDAAHEMVSRFGTGVVEDSEEIAVDEATGEVYVANGAEQSIDRFGPGTPAVLPAVDAPPPSLSSITRTSALLSATVATGDATTEWKLEYVPAGEYQAGALDPYAAGGSTGLAKLSPSAQGTEVGPVPLTGLLAGTTYDYRLVASNELGSTYGPNHSFTTAAATPPIVTTGPAAEVTQTGVLLTGMVNTRELQTSYEFEVGTSTAYEGAKLFGNAGSGGVEAVSASLQFLIPGMTYHYRLLASNEDGTTYGQDMTFTTPGVLQPISQPVAEAFVPSPTVQFPSVAGAISKPVGSGKSSKKKAKTKKKSKTKRKKKGGKQGKGRKASVGRRSGTAASTGTHARGGGKGK